MENNIVYGTISADGKVHIDGKTYVIERDFPNSILFLRIDKSELGFEAMLSVKSDDDTSLQLFRETVQLTISEDLLTQVEDFQSVRRSIDEAMRYVGFQKRSHKDREGELTEAIYQTFFPINSDIGTVCRDFLNFSQSNKIKELLLVISSEDERIQNLPWEMVLPKLTVGTSADLPKDNFGLIRTRQETLQQFNQQGPTAQQAPLKMLFIPALPENLPERSKLLEIESEQQKIIEAVRGLEATGDQQPMLVMEILDSADLTEIKEALSARSHDIVHISGHGAYVEDVKHGILYLENENGDQRKTTGHELGEVLRSFASIRLLVLSACETAVGGSEGSTAEQMAAVGLPAVLAMRFSITDAGARLFTQKLYQRLAYGDTLTKAVHDARQALWAHVWKRRTDTPQLPTAAEWFTPVLYQNQLIGPLVKRDDYNTLTVNRFYPKATFLKGAYTRLIGEGFIGRKRLLIQLRQCFRLGQHVCLHGLGGLGKTTTAEAFADHYRRQNGHDILIFRKDTEINEAVMLERIFKRWKSQTQPDDDLADALKSQLDTPQIPPNAKLQLLIDNYLKGRRNILILDNFEDVQTATDDTQQQSIVSESLRTFIRYLLQNAPSNCHILFTTRYHIADLNELVTHLAVDKMTYAEQYRYVNFSDTLRQIPIAAREILNRRFDGHPRAFQFLEGLLRNDRRFDLTQLNVSLGVVETQVFDNLLLERIINQLSETERDVFTVSSVFFSRTPLATLCAVLKKQAEELTPILASLRSWSLCFWDEHEQTFEVHTLTRTWMRQQERPTQEQFRVLSYKIGEFYKNKSRPTTGETLLEKAYFEQAEAWNEYASAASALEHDYRLAGLYTAARDIMQAVLAKNISTRLNGTILGRLGQINSLMGNESLAFTYYQQSLEIHRQIDNKNGIAAALNNLGSYYSTQKDFEQALRYYKQSLKIQQQDMEFSKTALSDYSTDLAARSLKCITLSNIGDLYSVQGNYKAAIKYFELSLKTDIHVGKQITLNNLGQLYNNQGKYEWALDSWKKSLELARAIGDQRDIAITMCNMGILYFDKLHNVEKAIPLLLESFTIFNRIGVSDAEVPASWFKAIFEEIGEEKFNQIIKSIEND